jgi:hypothetical protein
MTVGWRRSEIVFFYILMLPVVDIRGIKSYPYLSVLRLISSQYFKQIIWNLYAVMHDKKEVKFDFLLLPLFPIWSYAPWMADKYMFTLAGSRVICFLCTNYVIFPLGFRL